uniref:NADH-ubiquinone oxidoreductase chain 2 n=1 Tax=Clavelina oblonga TaxID=286222 RepID=A0A024FSG2_9ASCI|nr:NADH dehydrogenase subunit 2 [Clavelina oblonga]CAL24384.1 NADH dehydrogenase subunit 2 [Clavelina oblonga]
MLFILLLLIFFFLSFFSSSMIILWVYMEVVSLIIFFFLLTYMGGNMLYKNLLIIKYFFIQTISGCFILVFMITDLFFFSNPTFILFFLSVKIGLFPTYGWVLELYSSLSLEECFVMGVIPKIIPVMMLVSMGNNIFIYILSFLSIFFGGMNGLKYSDMRQIMAMSSVMNMGFLILSSFFGTFLFMFMMFIYIYSMYIFFMMLKFNNSYNLTSFDNKNKKIFFLSILLLGLAGLPITFLFFFKFMMIVYLLDMGYTPLMLFSVLIVSMVNSIFYTRAMNFFMNINGFKYFYMQNSVLKIFGSSFFLLSIFGIIMFFFFF